MKHKRISKITHVILQVIVHHLVTSPISYNLVNVVKNNLLELTSPLCHFNPMPSTNQTDQMIVEFVLCRMKAIGQVGEQSNR